jgi:hypothetical protein
MSSGKLTIQVNLLYQYDDQVGDFGGLHALIDQLHALKADATVDVEGRDGPVTPLPAPVPAARRGRRAKANGHALEPENASPEPAGDDATSLPLDLASETDTPEDGGGLDDDLSPPALSPAEAKAKSLDTLRTIYNSHAPGSPGRRAVQKLQKELAVAKFQDVPDEDGHALLKSVIVLAEQVGHQV